MYTEKQFEQLEQEERELTEEAILFMLLLLSTTRNDLERELRDFYSKYGRDGVITYSEVRKWISQHNHQRRLTALLLSILERFTSLNEELTPQFKDFLTKVIKKESEFFDVKIEPEEILEKEWGVDESTWKKRLAADVALWGLLIANDIKQFIHRRALLDEVLSQLHTRFNSIEKILNKLAITESTAVGSFARQEIFRKLGITKYQFYAKADERTCESCGSLHEKIFPISAYEVGVTASPIHPRCRCWEVPITE